jgi:hypothetical protein
MVMSHSSEGSMQMAQTSFPGRRSDKPGISLQRRATAITILPISYNPARLLRSG